MLKDETMAKDKAQDKAKAKYEAKDAECKAKAMEHAMAED